MNITPGTTFGHWNRHKVNRLIAACVAGLSVSLAVALGTTTVWDSDGSSARISPAYERPVAGVPSSVEGEDWGLVAQAFLRPRPSTTFAGSEFLGIGQPGEGVKSVTAPLIDPTDFGSIGAAYAPPAAPPQFATAADAVFAAESLLVEPAPVILNDALGIGQPAGGLTEREQALVEDVSDFGAYSAEYLEWALQFGTAADAVYAVEGLIANGDQSPFVGALVDGVYVIEDFQ